VTQNGPQRAAGAALRNDQGRPRSWPEALDGVWTHLDRIVEIARTTSRRSGPSASALTCRHARSADAREVLALTSAEESISMRIKAPARLAVAWLTMFLVGTELFVFSPFAAGAGDRLPHSSVIGGAVGDDVFVSLYGERSAVRIFLGSYRAPAGFDRFTSSLFCPRQYPHRRRCKPAVPACSQAFCRCRGGRCPRPSIYAPRRQRRPHQTAGPPGWRLVVLRSSWSRWQSARRAGGLVGFPRRRAAGIPQPLAGLGLVLVWLNRWVWPCDHGPRRSRYLGAASSRSACRCCFWWRPLDPNGTLEYGPLRASIPTSAPASLPSASRTRQTAAAIPLLWLRRNRRGSCGWPCGPIGLGFRFTASASLLLACALALLLVRLALRTRAG